MFSKLSLAQLEQLIVDSELETSAELRIRIESTCPEKFVVDRALAVFKELEMEKTKLQNGVLFYLSTDDKQFAVLGDKGVHNLVGQSFWDEVRNNALRFFKVNKHKEGLEFAISQVLIQLKNHFPYQEGDINELTNEVSTN